MSLYKQHPRSQHPGARYRTTMKPVLSLPVLVLFSAVLFTPAPAPAAIITSNPNVPPGMAAGSSTGFYLTGPAPPLAATLCGKVRYFSRSAAQR